MLEQVHRAMEVIRAGGIILYPTDTIWGIGCDATNRDAIRRIYTIKKRSDHKSMLVLVNGFTMLTRYLDSFPEEARKVLEKATKPTTIVYPAAKGLAPDLLGTDGSIGIRITSDPFCSMLIELLERPLVSTSANIAGAAYPPSFSEIHASLREQVDLVVNWRQEEASPSQPSAILKIDSDGRITPIRS